MTTEMLNVEFTGRTAKKFSKLLDTAYKYAEALTEEYVPAGEAYFKDTAKMHLFKGTALVLIKNLESHNYISEVDILEVIRDDHETEKAFKAATRVTGVTFEKGGSIHTDHPAYHVMKYFYDYLYSKDSLKDSYLQSRRICLAEIFACDEKMAG